MKITLDQLQFTFTPTSNLISFDNMLGAFEPERLLAVINTTTGKLVYASASQPSGFGGTFASGTYTNSQLTYASSNTGQSASDILQVLYDSETASQNISASDGTQILTTTDAMSLQEGLNVNMLNSSFGGQVGSSIPIPNNNNALSMAFLNGSVLSTPKMDPVTNELIVQTNAIPLQDVNITQVGSTAIGANLPIDIAAQSLGNVSTNVNFSGVAAATNIGANSTGSLRTSSNIALNGTNVTASLGANDSGTIRTSSNISFNGVAAATQSGTATTGTQRVIIATDQPVLPSNISQYGGVSTTLGQKAMTSSMPVAISSDQSTLNTSLPDLYISGAPNSAAGNNNLLAVAGPGELDVSGYKSASVQVISTATSGTFIFEGSNTPTSATFQVVPAFRIDSASPNAIVTAITATNSNLMYIIPVRFRYMRMRIVTGLSTPVQALTRLSQDPFTPSVSNVINATAGNLNCTVVGSLTSVGSVTSLGTVTTVSTVASASLAATTITDIASAAITTTQTSANILTGNQQNMAFQVGVSVVSGTNPTLDVVVQETFDGTNYYDIYHFPRITAIGQYRSPQIRTTGSGIRYVRTVGGTTPSFTNSVVRPVRQTSSDLFRNFFDRTLNPNTLNSTTATFFMDGCDQIQLSVTMNAGGTAPIIKMQGSEDNSNWYDLPSMSITAAVGAVTQIMSNATSMPRFVRSIVSAAGVGSSLLYVDMKGRGV